jgi:hypothetical protein
MGWATNWAIFSQNHLVTLLLCKTPALQAHCTQPEVFTK